MGLSELGATLRREANFRLARQPPTTVTWAELHFYDLPFDPPKWFRKQCGVYLANRQ